MRIMYDRRIPGWTRQQAFLFHAAYDDGLSLEVQVNPEFEATSHEEALKYARIIGQLPTSLRKDVDTVWIHRGVMPFGGGNRNLLIHTGQAAEYVSSGILEETLIHEASHTSLDEAHAQSQEWIQAQQEDDTYISHYAMDYPMREDVAESFLFFLAVEHLDDPWTPGLYAPLKPRSHIVWHIFAPLTWISIPWCLRRRGTFPYPNTTLTGLMPLGCWSGKVSPGRSIASKLLQI